MVKSSRKFFLFLLGLFFLLGCKKDQDNQPSNVKEVIEDVAYGPAPLQNMNIHIPKNANSETKVVILVHGGGWVTGYHPSQPVTTFKGRFGWNLHDKFIKNNIACVTLKYRTACYNTQPAYFTNQTTLYLDQMIEDINLAIQYLIDNQSKYTININDIQLVGESAGGHIVMSYAISALAKDNVKSAVSMFGPTNLDAQDFKTMVKGIPLALVQPPSYFLKKSDNCTSVTNKSANLFFSLKSFADHQDIEVDQPNPFLDSISTTFAPNLIKNTPLFIAQGTDDFLVPHTQADLMKDALEAKWGAFNCDDTNFDCTYKMKKYSNCGHGWMGGNCNKTEIMNDILNWVQNH